MQALGVCRGLSCAPSCFAGADVNELLLPPGQVEGQRSELEESAGGRGWGDLPECLEKGILSQTDSASPEAPSHPQPEVGDSVPSWGKSASASTSDLILYQGEKCCTFTLCLCLPTPLLSTGAQ